MYCSLINGHVCLPDPDAVKRELRRREQAHVKQVRGWSQTILEHTVMGIVLSHDVQCYFSTKSIKLFPGNGVMR
jgi:hypothetical protein